MVKMNFEVRLGSEEEGVIEGHFGQSGKVKVHIPGYNNSIISTHCKKHTDLTTKCRQMA